MFGSIFVIHLSEYLTRITCLRIDAEEVLYRKEPDFLNKKTPCFFRAGCWMFCSLVVYKAILPISAVTPVVTVMFVFVTGLKGNAGVTVTE